MNLNDYFNPVSLEKPDFHMVPGNLTFSRSLRIHTPDTPVKNIEKYDLAIIGVPEDQNAVIKGSSSAPDHVRSKLYQLSSLNRKVSVIDLGNIKITGNINDTYFALRDLTSELRTKDVVPVFIGGSQDLTHGIVKAFEIPGTSFTLGSIDARIDFGYKEKQISSANYLDIILSGKKPSDFNFFNLGHQVYFSHTKIIDQLEKRGYECVRLGTARTDLSGIEPYLRDTGFLSIDMCSVRHSDAPGVTIPSPNGFYGHELCQIARYAGTATKIEGIGFFELSPENDINDHTSHLTAQAIWYFMEGFSLKMNEKADRPGNKKYIVNLGELKHKLIFYKSTRSDRWWMELPVADKASGNNIIISCTYKDYLQACNQDIPDRWLKAYTRFH